MFLRAQRNEMPQRIATECVNGIVALEALGYGKSDIRTSPFLTATVKIQSSWLQIQGSGFDSRHYQIFWWVVGLERGPLSLVSTTEEQLERKSSGSGLENREYGHRDPSRLPHGTLYPQKLALTSLTSSLSSVAVPSQTQATEFSFSLVLQWGYAGFWMHSVLSYADMFMSHTEEIYTRIPNLGEVV
jgi:hypothetical protein